MPIYSNVIAVYQWLLDGVRTPSPHWLSASQTPAGVFQPGSYDAAAKNGSGGRTRTADRLVMGQMSCRCSTPLCLEPHAISHPCV